MASDLLHRVIASIYGAVFQQPLISFQDFVLNEIRTLVPFDSAVWASGTHETNSIQAVHLLNLPADLMMRYKMEYVATDYLRARAIAEPGTSFRIEDVTSLEDYYALPAYTELGQEIGIDHAMATAQTDPISGLSQLLLLWRADRDRPFSIEQRQIKQTLAPHIFDAWQHRQLVAMGTASAGIRDPQLAESRAICIVDSSGMIYAVVGDFGDQFSKAVGGWIGPNLPDFVVDAMRSGANGLTVGAYSISFSRTESRTIVAITPQTQTEHLSASELRTAQRFSEGATYREIAAEHGLSTATVRNQISAAYRKLNVHSKVELVKTLTPSN